MSFEALLLVLTGAACHASWNIVAKRCAGGMVFVWLFGLVSIVAATPFALWRHSVTPQSFTSAMWSAALASAFVHVLYSLVLQRGYQVSDFSVVYPIARGTGPIFSVAGAVLLWGEQPSLSGAIGVVAVLSGVFISAGGASFLHHRDAGTRRTGVLWGMLTGLHIAGYTIIDGWAIKDLGMSPIQFYAVGLVARTVLLTPFMLPRMREVGPQWRAHRSAILVVGLLSPLAYTLVLLAVQIAPLSYVAPVREVSMLIGTVIGARLLGEKLRLTQLVGASLMLGGVIGVALA